jgi:hypothetical protein
MKISMNLEAVMLLYFATFVIVRCIIMNLIITQNNMCVTCSVLRDIQASLRDIQGSKCLAADIENLLSVWLCKSLVLWLSDYIHLHILLVMQTSDNSDKELVLLAQLSRALFLIYAC